MNTELVIIDPKEFGLDETQAHEIEQHFTPVIAERESLATIYHEIVGKEISKELTNEARELRLKLVKVRTNTDKIHQTQKAFYLAGGRFVDAWKNKTKIVLEQMEEKLSTIENHYINIEKERIEKLTKERIEILSKYCDNPESYPVAQMSEEAFNNLIEGQKLIIRQRAEEAKKAEKERIDKELREAKERERIRLENEQLRKQNEAKELELQKERQKSENERQEQLKIQAEKDRIAQIEKDQKDAEIRKFQDQLKQKQEAEQRERDRLAEIEKQKQFELEKAKLAPVKERLTLWINDISITLPVGVEPNQTTDEIISKFESFRSWAIVMISKMQ